MPTPSRASRTAKKYFLYYKASKPCRARCGLDPRAPAGAAGRRRRRRDPGAHGRAARASGCATRPPGSPRWSRRSCRARPGRPRCSAGLARPPGRRRRGGDVRGRGAARRPRPDGRAARTPRTARRCRRCGPRASTCTSATTPRSSTASTRSWSRRRSARPTPSSPAHARSGLRVCTGREALAALMVDRDAVAVAGAHGKTTTSAMIATALLHAGADPSFAIGGTVLSDDGPLGGAATVRAGVRRGGRRVGRLLPGLRAARRGRHQRRARPPRPLRLGRGVRGRVRRVRGPHPAGRHARGLRRRRRAPASSTGCATTLAERGVAVVTYGRRPAPTCGWARRQTAIAWRVRLDDAGGRGTTVTARRPRRAQRAQRGGRVGGRAPARRAASAAAAASAAFRGTGRRFEHRGRRPAACGWSTTTRTTPRRSPHCSGPRAPWPATGAWSSLFQPHLYSRTRTFATSSARALRPRGRGRRDRRLRRARGPRPGGHRRADRRPRPDARARRRSSPTGASRPRRGRGGAAGRPAAHRRRRATSPRWRRSSSRRSPPPAEPAHEPVAPHRPARPGTGPPDCAAARAADARSPRSSRRSAPRRRSRRRRRPAPSPEQRDASAARRPTQPAAAPSPPRRRAPDGPVPPRRPADAGRSVASVTTYSAGGARRYAGPVAPPVVSTELGRPVRGAGARPPHPRAAPGRRSRASSSACRRAGLAAVLLPGARARPGEVAGEGAGTVVAVDQVLDVVDAHAGTPLPRLDTVRLRDEVLDVPGCPRGTRDAGLAARARGRAGRARACRGGAGADGDSTHRRRATRCSTWTASRWAGSTRRPRACPWSTCPVGDKRALTAVLSVLQLLPADLLAQVADVSAHTQDTVTMTAARRRRGRLGERPRDAAEDRGARRRCARRRRRPARP